MLSASERTMSLRIWLRVWAGMPMRSMHRSTRRRAPMPADINIITTTMTTTIIIDRRPLLSLLAWVSPAFPVGGFAYSHGLEWAVETGDVRDGAALREWIADVLRFG